jgi:hypothetical protein
MNSEFTETVFAPDFCLEYIILRNAMAAKDESSLSSLKPAVDPENPPFTAQQIKTPLKAIRQRRRRIIDSSIGVC